MLEQYFEDNFKGFRDEIRQELNSRIYGAIQDVRGDVAESFFTEAKQKVKLQSAKKEVELDPESEEGRRIAAADFAMKQDVFGESFGNAPDYKNKKDWEASAKQRGYVIRQSTDLDGEFGDYWTAKDKTGNFKGEFHNKRGGHLNPNKSLWRNTNEEVLDELKGSVYRKQLKSREGYESEINDIPLSRKRGRDFSNFMKKGGASMSKLDKMAWDKQFEPSSYVNIRHEGNRKRKNQLKEDTAEYSLTLVYPDGERQNDFRVMGANEDDLKTRLTNIFGSNNGYKFENIRKNEG